MNCKNKERYATETLAIPFKSQVFIAFFADFPTLHDEDVVMSGYKIILNDEESYFESTNKLCKSSKVHFDVAGDWRRERYHPLIYTRLQCAKSLWNYSFCDNDIIFHLSQQASLVTSSSFITRSDFKFMFTLFLFLSSHLVTICFSSFISPFNTLVQHLKANISFLFINKLCTWQWIFTEDEKCRDGPRYHWRELSFLPPEKEAW